MPPESPPAQAPHQPPVPGGQYDFILADPKSSRPRFGLGGGSNKTRLLIALVGGLGALALIIGLFSLIFGGGDGGGARLNEVAARQQEIIRLSDTAVRKFQDDRLRAAAATAKTVVQSDQNNVKSLLGKALDKKSLAAYRSKTTDDLLLAAEQNGRYDSVAAETLRQALGSYQASLKNIPGGPKTHAILKLASDNASVIIKGLDV